MSIVPTQNEFMGHVAQLIQHAQSLGFMVTGGELYRTPEQQKIYVKEGKSKTMNSNHLKRLAIDLNFFLNGELTYDVKKLAPIGKFWEQLHPNNSWGGNWISFKDAPHFERRT